MKRLILTAIASLFIAATPLAASAATPTRADIQSRAADYQQLLKRFNDGQQLTTDEYTTVYYGSALQRGFNPAQTYDKMLRAFESRDYASALRLCEDGLKSDPTNLALLFKAFASAMASSDPTTKTKAISFQTRLLGICDAIFNSGSGVTDMSPYIVIRPSDADEFLVKYIQPVKIIGRAKVGNLDAAKVNLEGIADEVILYFKQF